jgi:hypothetical protein
VGQTPSRRNSATPVVGYLNPMSVTTKNRAQAASCAMLQLLGLMLVVDYRGVRKFAAALRAWMDLIFLLAYLNTRRMAQVAQV